MQDLADATVGFRSAVVKVLADIESMKSAMRDMFAVTRSTLEQIGMTHEQQVDYIWGQIHTQQNIAMTSTDPYVAYNAVKNVDSLFNQLLSLQTPAEQLANRDSNIAWLNQWETDSTARMTQLGVNIAGMITQPFADAKVVLDNAADLFQAAAIDQGAAATEFSAAVSTFVSAVGAFGSEFPLHIVVDNPATSEVGGGA
jgi:hypothetical protein